MMNHSEIQTACAAYESGKTVPEIAADLGRSRSTVYRALTDEGVQMRKRGPRVKVGAVCQGGQGYLSERTEDGWELQHRVVMARTLGRPLRSDEQVHHINGDRTDNRPENLQLRNGNHGSGQALRCRSCGSHDLEPYELS